MKKLLGFLGAFAISASASTSVIACQPDNTIKVGSIDASLNKLNGVPKEIKLSEEDYTSYTDSGATNETKGGILGLFIQDTYSDDTSQGADDSTFIDEMLDQKPKLMWPLTINGWIEYANGLLEGTDFASNSIDATKITNFVQFFEAVSTLMKVENFAKFFVTELGLDRYWSDDNYEEEVTKEYTDEEIVEALTCLGSGLFVIDFDTIDKIERVVLYGVNVLFSKTTPQPNYLGGMILNVTKAA